MNEILVNLHYPVSSYIIPIRLVLFLRLGHVPEQSRVEQLVIVDGVHEVDVGVVAEGDTVVVHDVGKLAE